MVLLEIGRTGAHPAATGEDSPVRADAEGVTMTKYLISFPSGAKIARACRCAQEVRAFQFDPAS